MIVHGPLALEEVATLYQAADVFVLAASRESYGTVWGEAMAFGLPVVGWHAGNLPNLAEDAAKDLVEPGDTDALSKALLELALEGDRAAGRQRAPHPLTPNLGGHRGAFFAAINEVNERGAAR